jgi:hypothetical protein
MEHPGLVDQQELLRWADTVAARTEFPRLLRRLVLETGRGVAQIGVPAGEGTSVGGWDGTVRATEGTAHVPAGLSVWELSVEKSVGTKADKDYAKRLTTPDGSPTSDCTYVAASLRRWAARADWARDRTAEKRWAEVRAYGVDDIETWLETAPVTWAWISERLGLHPTGVRSAESWWDSWSAKTAPVTTAPLVKAGRASEANGLADRLPGEPQVTTITGAGRDEILAFVAAVGIEDASSGTGQLLARTAFVDDVHAWRRIVAHPSPLVLVPLADDLANEVPSDCGHHIVVPKVGAATPDIELSPIDANEAAAAIRATGEVEEDRADELGRLARRSLTALRRRLAISLDLHQPAWATAPVPRTVRGLLLAGSWADDRAGDQGIVAELAGADYPSLREALDGLAASADPFVALDGGIWSVVSLYDAWLLLRAQLREDDLTRLDDAVTIVLGERDPALDLPDDERWKASLHGKVREYSGALRRGLAKTLALLGTHGEVIRASYGQTGANVASYLVRKLLDQANADATGERWASISDLLPLLAEAGPDSFIDAVRMGLTGDAPVLARMFTDAPGRDNFFSSSSPHTSLLWALENTVWSSDHFGAAVDLLARLRAIDPGGQLSNRPFSSLASIFTPWHPENAVPVERRLDVIDGLRKRHPDTAWRLLLTMLPEFHGVHMPTHEPKYRDWKPPRRPVTNLEYFNFVFEVVMRAIADAGHDPGRWSELVGRGTQLPPDERRRVAETLDRTVSSGAMDGLDTTQLWKALRDLVGRHREYSTADWALPAAEVDVLDDLASKLEPSGGVERVVWLFDDHMPHLGEQRRQDNHEAYEAQLAELRRAAVDDLEQAGGLAAVLDLAERSVVAWSVGVSLADATGDKPEADLLSLLDESERTPRLELAHAYFARRFTIDGWEWLNRLLDTQPGLTPHQQARLLLAARDIPKVWQVADERGKAVADEYWRLFGYFGLGGDFTEVETVATRLMRVGRFAATLHFLDIYGRRNPPDEERIARLAADAFDGLLHVEDAELHQLRQHDFLELFGLLERHALALGEERVASLEWSFLPALRFDPEVPSLHRFMAADPAFFVQIVSTVYRPRDGEEESDDQEPEDEGTVEDDATRERRATNAYHLLSSWDHVPGLQPDRQIDAKQLRDWLDEATRLLREASRYDAGMSHIGKMLVSAPPDADGSQPCEAVRDLLEDLQSEVIEEAFFIGVLNRRGVTSRRLEDGGTQEQELVRRHQTDAQRFADRWPRTAAILRSLAKNYENEARRDEESAERFRRGLER